MKQGKIYLIGAGPGDPGLLTLKGCRLICQADVILYDHLVSPEILSLAKPSAEKISVGKSAGKHTLPQNQITALLLEKAKTNSVVVRLKGGDPFLFGRGGEEAQACVNAAIDFEVVSGVTSALAAPSYAGIPPTHRDFASSVAIVTGHRQDEKQIDIPKADTVIFLMGASNIENIVETLIKNGWPQGTKIAAIENGTCYNQRVTVGSLKDFPATVKKIGLQPPAVFIVGKVVELGDTLSWFDKKPNVLVLGNFPQKYSYLGNIVHRRIIDCVELDNYSHIDAVLKEKLASFDWLVFTSASAVKHFFARLYAIARDARALASIKIAAIGKTTAEKLREFGISTDMVPAAESSAGLLAEFAKLNIANKKILLPQSQIASPELADGLIKLHAAVEQMPVYKTIDIDPGDIDFAYIDQILFTSGSTVRAFIKRFGKVPEHIKSYCLGQPTLNETKKFNIQAEIVPAPPK